MKTREEFIDLLENSRDVSQQVVEFLKEKGYAVEIIPGTTTPDEESRWEHTDSGDIEIRQRIEVKHWPNIDFKSIDEIPYEYIIIDEAYKIDKKHELTLFAYIIVNASRTGCAIVGNWTRKHWFRRKMSDGREERECEYVMVRASLLDYISIEETE